MNKQDSTITLQDVSDLNAIVARLNARYPGDWYSSVSALKMAAVGAVVGWVSVELLDSVWTLLVPTATFLMCGVSFIAAKYERIPGMPRWQHKKAILEAPDQAKVREIYFRLPKEHREAVQIAHPFATGREFWWFMSNVAQWGANETPQSTGEKNV